MEYIIRSATPDDYDLIYILKSQSVRPYVEKIWGWDESYQQNDFDRDFSQMDQFKVIEINGEFIGFMQYYLENSCYNVVEIHLLSEHRGNGIGSDILKTLQEICITQGKKIQLGCFKENVRAQHLYQKLGFIEIGETDTHYIMDYDKGSVSVNRDVAQMNRRLNDGMKRGK